MRHERFARRHDGDREQHQRADGDNWNGPHPAHEQCGLALVDVVVLTGRGRRLGQIGGVSRPAFDLESPLSKASRKTGKFSAMRPVANRTPQTMPV
jgi:hypothetical protein